MSAPPKFSNYKEIMEWVVEVEIHTISSSTDKTQVEKIISEMQDTSVVVISEDESEKTR